LAACDAQLRVVSQVEMFLGFCWKV
jgi:hypothetical protein